MGKRTFWIQRGSHLTTVNEISASYDEFSLKAGMTLIFLAFIGVIVLVVWMYDGAPGLDWLAGYSAAGPNVQRNTEDKSATIGPWDLDFALENRTDQPIYRLWVKNSSSPTWGEPITSNVPQDSSTNYTFPSKGYNAASCSYDISVELSSVGPSQPFTVDLCSHDKIVITGNREHLHYHW